MPPTATIHGESGAVKELLTSIADSQISDLKDFENFQKEYPRRRQEMVEKGMALVQLQLSKLNADLAKAHTARNRAHEAKASELEGRKRNLERELAQLVPQRLFLEKISGRLRAWLLKLRVWYVRKSLPFALYLATQKHDNRIAALKSKVGRIESDLKAEAERAAGDQLQRLDRLGFKVEKMKFLYYGAIAENEVIERLGRLPSDYHVINDFRRSFSKPIYNRAERDRIYSIQIDHLVVGPTGIYVIETKNWSEETLFSGDHFSPFKQVRRAGFALFVLINQALNPRGIRGLFGRWRGKKLSIKQVLVFRNRVPQEKHPYVKVLSVGSLNSYVTFGSRLYDPDEVQAIVDFLVPSRRR